MQTLGPDRARPAQLALYWLGIQSVWGALLAISLQARSAELVGDNALAAYGILAISGAVVAAVVQIIAGIASDRYRRSMRDRVVFYAAGGVVGAVGIIWFYLAPTFAQVIGAYAVVQLGLNAAMAAYQPVIPDVVKPESTGVASSWMAAFQSLGNAVGAVIAAKIGDARVVAATIVAILLATLVATARHVVALPLRRDDVVAVQSVRGAFATLFGSRLLVYVGFFTLLGYLFFYVQANASAATTLAGVKATSGLLVLAFTLAGAMGAALAARPSDSIDKRIVAGCGGAGVVVALIALIVTHDLMATYAATTFAGAAWGVFLVADWALACRVLPPNSLGTSMSIWNLAVVLPQILAPLLTTVAVAHLPVIAGLDASRIAFVLACIEISCGLLWLLRLPMGVARNNAHRVIH